MMIFVKIIGKYQSEKNVTSFKVNRLYVSHAMTPYESYISYNFHLTPLIQYNWSSKLCFHLIATSCVAEPIQRNTPNLTYLLTYHDSLVQLCLIQHKVALRFPKTLSNPFCNYELFHHGSNLHEVCDGGCNCQGVSIGLDNELAPSRWPAFSWTNDGLVYWHIDGSPVINVIFSRFVGEL